MINTLPGRYRRRFWITLVQRVPKDRGVTLIMTELCKLRYLLNKITIRKI